MCFCRMQVSANFKPKTLKTAIARDVNDKRARVRMYVRMHVDDDYRHVAAPNNLRIVPHQKLGLQLNCLSELFQKS